MKTPRNSNRAGAQFGWAAPLRGPHRRYRRLASAAYRLGALALAGVVIAIVAQAHKGFRWPFVLMLVALAGLGAAGLVLGRSASKEARKLEDEIKEIETEAERQL